MYKAGLEKPLPSPSAPYLTPVQLAPPSRVWNTGNTESAGIALRSLFCGSPPQEASSEVSRPDAPFLTLLSACLLPSCLPLQFHPALHTPLPITSTPFCFGSDKVGKVGIL